MGRYFNKRTCFMVGLGFSSGLPFMLTNSTLQAWMTTSGLSIEIIGFFSLLALPYLWKFVWSPLFDSIRLPFLDHRRAWIVCMQIAIAVLLFCFSFMEPKYHLTLIAVIAFFIVFFSASQDIAINAYQVEILQAEERGFGSALSMLGYHVAMIVSTGIALILAGYWGFQVTYFIMACLMLVNIVFSVFAPKLPAMAKRLSLKAAVVEPFQDFLKRPSALLLLLFIVFYKLGNDFATALSTTFFLRELHFSLQVIGSVAKTVGLISAIVGTLIGGILLPRLGLFASLFLCGLLQMGATLFYLTASIVGPHIQLLVATVITENLTAGMGTTAFLALLISLCHREYSATQFALFSALMSIGRVVVGPFAGMIVTRIGWSGLFVWALLMALPALFMLIILKRKVDFKKLLGNN